MYTFTNSIAHTKPPNHAPKAEPWRIALLANLKDDFEKESDEPPDAGAEFDRLETIESIAAALETEGHWVHFCQADRTLVESLTNLRPHICFNIAEGLGGDGREAQAPALCELLEIPYTASQVLANAISLDKTQTKRIWQSLGLPTPRFQEIRSENTPLESGLKFPLLVKPAREGTGMGIDARSVVKDKSELYERIAWTLKLYRQPVLVEEYLPGREFTVGYIGNPGPSQQRRRPWLYDSDGYHFFPILEIDNTESFSPGVYGHDAKAVAIDAVGAPQYICPAPIPESLRLQLINLTRTAAESIGAKDVSRVDFRLDSHGKPYLLEINTLPGLNPAVSDLCIMAAAEDMPYDFLISEILYLAAERYHLPFETLLPPPSISYEIEPSLREPVQRISISERVPLLSRFLPRRS
jgi:D-alanine-D-alanine ligase